MEEIKKENKLFILHGKADIDVNSLMQLQRL